MSNRIFDTVVSFYIEEYQTIAGIPYDDKKFPTPGSVPKELLETVSNIKKLQLEQRQFEINEEVRKFPMIGDAFHIPADKKYLIDDSEEVKREIDRWSAG